MFYHLASLIFMVGGAVERFTISLDDSLAQQFDALIAARGYVNRSEAVRDLIRGAIEHDRQRVRRRVSVWPICLMSMTTMSENFPSA